MPNSIKETVNNTNNSIKLEVNNNSNKMNQSSAITQTQSGISSSIGGVGASNIGSSMNMNTLNEFVPESNNRKKSNRILNSINKKQSKKKGNNQVQRNNNNTNNPTKKENQTKTNSVSRINNLKPSGTKGIDFSLTDINKSFGGLLIFPEFASDTPLKECDGESGYQKRYDELLQESISQADEMKNSFTEVGSYLTVSPKEAPVFVKKLIKVDCIPVEPKIEPNTKNKNDPCWNTKECKSGLRCNNKDKYIKGVCVEGGKEKALVGKNGKCSSDVNCEEGLVCRGNPVLKFLRRGKCSDAVDTKSGPSSKKNTLSERSGFVS
jgi:hypothetical protein